MVYVFKWVGHFPVFLIFSCLKLSIYFCHRDYPLLRHLMNLKIYVLVGLCHLMKYADLVLPMIVENSNWNYVLLMSCLFILSLLFILFPAAAVMNGRSRCRSSTGYFWIDGWVHQEVAENQLNLCGSLCW